MQKKGTAPRSSVKMMAAKTPMLPNEEWDKMLEESKNGPVMVDFTASWCGPCKLMAPVVDSITEDWAGKLKVYVFDVAANQPRAVEQGINGLPYVTIYRDGVQVKDLSIEGMPQNTWAKLTNIA